MGGVTPTRQLECSKCKKKWSAEYSRNNYNPAYRLWNGVVAIEQRGEAILCRCNNCGHEYFSRSAAAWRELQRTQTVQA